MKKVVAVKFSDMAVIVMYIYILLNIDIELNILMIGIISEYKIYTYEWLFEIIFETLFAQFAHYLF